jgi:hypothetical protein
LRTRATWMRLRFDSTRVCAIYEIAGQLRIFNASNPPNKKAYEFRLW